MSGNRCQGSVCRSAMSCAASLPRASSRRHRVVVRCEACQCSSDRSSTTTTTWPAMPSAAVHRIVVHSSAPWSERAARRPASPRPLPRCSTTHPRRSRRQPRPEPDVEAGGGEQRRQSPTGVGAATAPPSATRRSMRTARAPPDRRCASHRRWRTRTPARSRTRRGTRSWVCRGRRHSTIELM